ncbi:ABC transporter substrate-binding protein [Nonlabens xiamenensis]|uniref:ABC transporter substrate-binding protein n=1 Tax=Nonlabens xiamenensis TaxID=2341043 RepID=UPI000F613011|nr:ABC transporter substrate-binding protein [Nonlabens xiamenensis]
MNKLYWILILSICWSCADQTKKIDDSTVFRYNEHANITSLDPAFSKDQRNIWACNLIYNGLVQLDNQMKVVPDLATEWEVSPDGLQYNFQLKKGIYFNRAGQQAPELTSADVKYSLERLRDPQLASPGAWVLERVNDIEIVDDYQIQISLDQPFPAFLGMLSMKYCSVVPEGSGTELRNQPIGTGPFYLKRWEENVKMVLRQNQSYWETDAGGNSLPYLEAVAISFKNDKQSEFLEFAQGNLDFINAIDPSYKDELLTTTGNLKEKYIHSIDLVKAPYLNTEYLGIKIDNPVQELQNPNLRKAMNLGFDRDKMIKYLRNNIGTPAVHGFIPQGLPGGGIVQGYTYDPKLARELVTQYKEETGDQNPSITISTGANYLDLCEYIQKEWQKIGITVEIEVMTPSTLRQARKVGQLDVFRSSWIADYPDAENYLALFYSDNFSPKGSNYTHFSKKQYDQWYETSLSTTNDSIRQSLYVAMDSLIIAEAPIIPLYYDQSVRFISKNVKGLESNPVNMLDLTRVYKN